MDHGLLLVPVGIFRGNPEQKQEFIAPTSSAGRGGAMESRMRNLAERGEEARLEEKKRPERRHNKRWCNGKRRESCEILKKRRVRSRNKRWLACAAKRCETPAGRSLQGAGEGAREQD